MRVAKMKGDIWQLLQRPLVVVVARFTYYDQDKPPALWDEFCPALPEQADENKLPYPAIRNQSNESNESYTKDPHIRT